MHVPSLRNRILIGSYIQTEWLGRVCLWGCCILDAVEESHVTALSSPDGLPLEPLFTIFPGSVLKPAAYLPFSGRMCLGSDFRGEPSRQLVGRAIWLEPALLCFVPVMNWLCAEWKPLEAYGSTVGRGICLPCCRSRSCWDLALARPWKIQDASLDVFVRLKWTDFISKTREANSVVALWMGLGNAFPCEHLSDCFPLFLIPWRQFFSGMGGVIAVVKAPERLFPHLGLCTVASPASCMGHPSRRRGSIPTVFSVVWL